MSKYKTIFYSFLKTAVTSCLNFTHITAPIMCVIICDLLSSEFGTPMNTHIRTDFTLC